MISKSQKIEFNLQIGNFFSGESEKIKTPARCSESRFYWIEMYLICEVSPILSIALIFLGKKINKSLQVEKTFVCFFDCIFLPVGRVSEK